MLGQILEGAGRDEKREAKHAKMNEWKVMIELNLPHFGVRISAFE
jgi:hypothetical protein